MYSPLKLGKKLILIVIVSVTLLSPSLFALAEPKEPKLTVIELRVDGKRSVVAYPATDDSMSNPTYSLLDWHWSGTAKYYVNPKNAMGLSTTTLTNTIKASANTWDAETNAVVFSYSGTTTRTAGKYDHQNVVSMGRYRNGVIGVTYLWSIGGNLVETDTILNTLYSWSLTGASNKMDVQNIMTHEFGHWCGLDDLYSGSDYWLTMYGYSNYGVTYQRTLGLGDINGLKAVYGP